MITGKNIVSIVSSHAQTDYVSLNECKYQCNIATADTTFDNELTIYLKSAMATVEGWLGYKIQKSNVVYGFDGLEQSQILRIPAKVVSITSVKYIDDADAEQTATSDYDLFNSLGLDIRVTDVPTLTEKLTKYKVYCVEGYEKQGASGVDEGLKFPENLKQAILLIVSQSFTNRQPVAFGGSPTEIPLFFRTMISPNQITKFT